MLISEGEADRRKGYEVGAMKDGGECCAGAGILSDIIDLGDVDLGELALLPGSVLDRSLRRVLTELTESLVTASFQSSLESSESVADVVYEDWRDAGRPGRLRAA